MGKSAHADVKLEPVDAESLLPAQDLGCHPLGVAEYQGARRVSHHVVLLAGHRTPPSFTADAGHGSCVGLVELVGSLFGGVGDVSVAVDR